MTQEMQTAVERLQSLPEEAQQTLAPSINDYLNRLEDLRAAVQEGFESGDAGELDINAIIREGRASFEAGR